MMCTFLYELIIDKMEKKAPDDEKERKLSRITFDVEVVLTKFENFGFS